MVIQVYLVFAWAGLAILLALMARRRGRNAFGWAFISLLLSPLVAGILLMVLKNAAAFEEVPAHLVRCPHCSQLVHKETAKCINCGAMTSLQYAEI